MGNELGKTAQGDLLIPGSLLGKIASVEPAGLRLIQLLDDLLICGYSQPGGRSKPLLYGDLRLFHVGELVALISSMHKNGTLHLLVPHAQKTIYFTEGEIVYATSTVEDDRLGEVLWRRGHLSLEQLSEVHDLVTPKKKLGAVLIERGMITPRQLYEGIKDQVLEIVYSAFHFEKGEFVFVEGKVRLRGAVRLDMDTRAAMKEGIKRVEEMTRLEEVFPHRQRLLVRKATEADLDEPERRIRDLVDGRRTVEEVIEESRLGEFDALKALARLQRVGLVNVAGQPSSGPIADSAEQQAVDRTSRMLRYIHQTLKAEIQGEEARLEAYLGSPAPKHREVFVHVGFDDQGRLDVETLARNARRTQPREPGKLALEALKGLYDYAVFQAMDALDDASCDAMMDRLQEMGTVDEPGE